MARRGIQTYGDVIRKTSDGHDLAKVFDEVLDVARLHSEQLSAIAQLLTFQTTDVADAVPQNVYGDEFERATEFGVPKAVGRDDPMLIGYSFDDWDLAARFSWKFLRSASLPQIQNAVGRAMLADQRLITREILKRLFSTTQKVSPEGNPVYGLWSGTDGMVPPPYMGRTFTSSEAHYHATQNATIDSADIEDAIGQITRKGYGRTAGSQILVLCNPDAEAKQIATWRAGQESRTGGPEALYDFIPATTAPARISAETIQGPQPPGEFQGVPVLGSYGEAWICPLVQIPANYLAVVACGGVNSGLNPIGFREHPDPVWRGFRIIPGNRARYPLTESFFQRSFGVGVRHRGAAVCLQVTAGSTYTAPTIIT